MVSISNDVFSLSFFLFVVVGSCIDWCFPIKGMRAVFGLRSSMIRRIIWIFILITCFSICVVQVRYLPNIVQTNSRSFSACNTLLCKCHSLSHFHWILRIVNVRNCDPNIVKLILLFLFGYLTRFSKCRFGTVFYTL